VRPDLAAYSKAIANGWPLGAITGSERWREAATKIFTTGSFWCEAVPMAAALATLTELRRIDGPAIMARMGQRLRDGLDRLAAKHGLAVSQSGPPQMPLVLFAGDAGFAKGAAFCSAALKAGAYFHPRHNMFLSCAHTEADIDLALEAADAGFAAAARMG